MKVCTFEGCMRPVAAYGLCKSHDKQRRAGKTLSPLRWQIHHTTEQERFAMSYRVDESTGCWLWTRSLDKNGYGTMRWQGKSIRATHGAWLLTYQDLPTKDPAGNTLWVLHHCDTPACVNPKHLYLGTPKQNIADMWNRGRAKPVIGAGHPDAKLTEEDVYAIRASTERYATIASRYGLAERSISDIKLRKSWTHLPARDDEAEINPGRHRGKKGASHYAAFVTEDIVRAIRASNEKGMVLAQQYGLKIQTVGDIRHRRSWKHVTEE